MIIIAFSLRGFGVKATRQTNGKKSPSREARQGEKAEKNPEERQDGEGRDGRKK
jgi:hypothetical protein